MDEWQEMVVAVKAIAKNKVELNRPLLLELKRVSGGNIQKIKSSLIGSSWILCLMMTISPRRPAIFR